MRTRVCLFLGLAPVLFAQTQDRPTTGEVEKLPAYVRRFSAGATLSVLGLNVFPHRSMTSVTQEPPVDAVYNTTNASQRVGLGVTAQLALTGRFAVTAGVFQRRVGYKMTSDIYTGIDNPETPEDERTHTVSHEDTRARFYDIPVALRYYGKDRHTPGPRWFVEIGAALRRVTGIRTSVDTTVNSGTTSCCEVTPANPALRTARGFVGGAGLQLIDGVGIRVVPEVRYTRWIGQTFNALSTYNARNQVEGMVSLTF